jgi:hypothetical protein
LYRLQQPVLAKSVHQGGGRSDSHERDPDWETFFDDDFNLAVRR